MSKAFTACSGGMQPYEITTRRITTYRGQLAEIPPDAPRDIRTSTCRTFFVSNGKASELRPRIKQTHIDVTEVEGGAWVYGGHCWLERTLKDLGMRLLPLCQERG
jgi:hypothetical protein